MNLGGGYLENDIEDSEWRLENNCTVACADAKGCRCYEAENLLIAENNASYSGGGMFIVAPKDFGFCSQNIGVSTEDWACPGVQNNRLSVSAGHNKGFHSLLYL